MAVVLSLSWTQTIVAENVITGECGDYLMWEYNTDTKTLTISDWGSMYDYSDSEPALWAPYAAEIETVRIGDEVEYIGENAFAGFTALTKAYFDGYVPSGVNETTFASAPEGFQIFVPRQYEDYYKDDWYFYSDIIHYEAKTEFTYLATAKITIADNAFLDADGNALPFTHSFDAEDEYGYIKVNGDAVTIGDDAFADNTSLTNFHLDELITKIGKRAFKNCSELVSIDGTDNLRLIDEEAFYCCALDNFEFPYNLQEIKREAFRANNFYDIILSGYISHIEADAFKNCVNLEKVKIKDTNVFTIGDTAFGTAVMQIIVPSDMEEDFREAWPGYGDRICSLTTSGECGEDLTWEYDEDWNSLIISGTGDMEDYDGSYATPWSEFLNEISDVQLPDGLTKIGSNAFYGLGLYSVGIPSTVTQIGDYAFAYCGNLYEVKINSATPPTLGENCFYDPSEDFAIKVSMQNLATYKEAWPQYAESIKADLPSGECGNDIEWYVNEDGTLVIHGYGSMYDYDSPEDTPWNEYREFIKSVKLVDTYSSLGISHIGAYALSNLNIETLTISNFVLRIGSHAIDGNSKLTTIIFSTTTPADLQGEKQFGDNDTLAIKVPASAVAAFKEAWPQYADQISRRPNPTGVWECFWENDEYGVMTWELDEEDGTLVIDGEGEMFEYETDPTWHEYNHLIKKVIINEGPTSICSNAFYYHTQLESIEIPASVKRIAYNVIGGAYNCKTLICHGTTPAICYNSTFSNRTDIDVYVPATAYNDYVNAPIWRDLNIIPSDATAEGDAGSDLKWLYCAEQEMLLFIGSGEMNNYTETNPAPWAEYKDNITNVIFSNKMTTIGDYAFEDHMALRAVTIPEGITAIGTHAFGHCNNLDWIVVAGNTPAVMTSEAFYAVQCSKVALHTPTLAYEAYLTAEGWKDFLVSPQVFNDVCTFEEEGDAGKWTLVNGEETNKWYIGYDWDYEAMKDGWEALYITSDEEDHTFTYNPSAASTTWAVYDTVLTDSIAVEFDWRCGGDAANNKMDVYLIPEDAEVSAATDAIPAGAQLIGTCSNSNDWQHFTEAYVADSKCKLALRWTNTSAGNTIQRPAAVDNVRVRMIRAVQQPSFINNTHYTSGSTNSTRKILRNGQILILRGNNIYTSGAAQTK